MKQFHWAIFTVLLFSLGSLKAQQNHFIYIQTEQKQPFYVKLDKKLYSSSASGYLIVPKLSAGEYNLAIGFPKNEWAEQQLTCNINTDAGFLLKNFGEKGWGLFDLQTMNVVLPATPAQIEAPVKNADIEVVNNNDAFSTMLSTVVNDSTIRQTETVRQPTPVVVSAPPVPEPETSTTLAVEPKTETGIVPAITTTVVVPDATQSKTSVPETTTLIVPEATIATVPTVALDATSAKPTMTLEEAKAILKKSEVDKGYVAEPVAKGQTAVVDATGAASIRRTSFATGKSGTVLVYVDDSAGDTITVVIPAEQTAAASNSVQGEIAKPGVNVESAAVAEVTPGKQNAKQPITAKEVTNEPGQSADQRFLDITVPASKNQPTQQSQPATTASLPAANKEKEVEATGNETEVTTSKKPPMINSDCKSFATEDDFLKVRKKMAAAVDDDEMIVLAKKVFKSKCFSVEQVKNLSVLFLKDAGKYSFFDMAYPFVADSDNFSILQRQLTESYYISRFQAMIRH